MLPGVVDSMIQSGKATVRVIPTPDKWFGVTYAEDKQSVIDAFAALYEQGVYNKDNLYAK